MRIQYLVDRQLDVVSGGTVGGADGDVIIITTPDGVVTTLPFLSNTVPGAKILANNPLASIVEPDGGDADDPLGG